MRKLRFKKHPSLHGKRVPFDDTGDFEEVDIADDVFGASASLIDYENGLRRLDDESLTALATRRKKGGAPSTVVTDRRGWQVAQKLSVLVEDIRRQTGCTRIEALEKLRGNIQARELLTLYQQEIRE